MKKKITKKQWLKIGLGIGGVGAAVVATTTLAACAGVKGLISKTAFMTSKFNTVDDAIAFGIQPNIIQEYAPNAESKAEAAVPKYLTNYINTAKQGTSVWEVDFATTSPATMAAKGVYSVAANSGDVPDKYLNEVLNMEKGSSSSAVTFNETEVTNLKSLLEKGVISTSVITDRNDVPQWRYSAETVKTGFVGPQVWDTTGNKIVTVSEVNQNNTKYEPTNDNQMFNWYNDPYAEFKVFAQSLSLTNYKFSDFSWLKTAVKGKESTSFINYAENVNTALRNYASSIVNLSAFNDKSTNKGIAATHKTALFVTAPTAGTNATNAYNTLYMEQPALFPNYYSQPDNAQLPGFGFSFPKPLNDSGTTKSSVPFDNWYEIGAAATNGAGSTTVGEQLANSFKGTADYVFYFYDSTKLKVSEQTNLLNQIAEWNKNPSNHQNIDAVKMLKSGGKIIPLDRNIMYMSSWGPVGTYVQIKGMADVLNNIMSNSTDIPTVKTAIDTAVANAGWHPFTPENLHFVTPNLTKSTAQAQAVNYLDLPKKKIVNPIA